MSMGPWGLHYERTQTWWEQSAAWHQYLARCQYLLRQGLFVADICFLQPEGSPRRFSPTMAWRTGNTPDRPRYNFDGCTPEVVMTRMQVKDGRLILPDGMSYRLLVLPQVSNRFWIRLSLKSKRAQQSLVRHRSSLRAWCISRTATKRFGNSPVDFGRALRRPPTLFGMSHSKHRLRPRRRIRFCKRQNGFGTKKGILLLPRRLANASSGG